MLSEVLARVEGEELGAACKVLAVTVTDMDTYRSDVGDDEEFKLARDSNKVGQIVAVTLTHIYKQEFCRLRDLICVQVTWWTSGPGISRLLHIRFRISGAPTLRAQFPGKSPDVRLRPPEQDGQDGLLV